MGIYPNICFVFFPILVVNMFQYCSNISSVGNTESVLSLLFMFKHANSGSCGCPHTADPKVFSLLHHFLLCRCFGCRELLGGRGAAGGETGRWGQFHGFQPIQKPKTQNHRGTLKDMNVLSDSISHFYMSRTWIYFWVNDNISLTWIVRPWLGIISLNLKPWFQGLGEQWGRDQIYPDLYIIYILYPMP